MLKAKTFGTITALFFFLMPIAAFAQTTWTMPTAFPDTNFHTRNDKQFAEEVAKETQGKLIINVVSNGVLLKLSEMKRGVQTGQVQLGESFIGTMANEAPIFYVDSIPFLNSNPQEAKALWAAARPLIEARLDKQNIHVLYSVAWPAQGLYTKKPVNSLNDFKGLKFRASSSSIADFAKQIGAMPTVVQASDVPQAFLTGQIDAMLTSSTTGVDTQAWDFVSYFYNVPTLFPQNIVLVNKKVWEALDPETRKIVTAAAARAEERGWQLGIEENELNIEKLRKNKMNVSAVNSKLNEEFHKIGGEMADSWLSKLTEQERAVLMPTIKRNRGN